MKPFLEQHLAAVLDRISPCPWPAHTGRHSLETHRVDHRVSAPLYTPEERIRRDSSAWTLVQGILAPVQFLAFLISLGFVLRYLSTGEGANAATISVLVKTVLLYTIMITGCIWEKVVFGRWLFAPAFFWEDVFSMVVLALHTLYLGMVLLSVGSPREQLLVALAAYATYAINAAQFIWKLRMARLQAPARPSAAPASGVPA
ncbi:2-vinyl bacteriochlorophyllide hydratase [Brevundimonas variabilis]|uniref:3-vinyl bacteriochlorophyllide hydratase n=1 Tax=Brevundimonas variabilis TaxID=74312 RepID=A0A7W9CI49_9CAUL|nr:2-vinyl bacteriochlorophyllide hydratase [Brevundimonas variabilis]MBB5746063.1 3-vinyl bacteriochlorophyllide hydratase [Brevundimonas variabilis]